MPELGWISADGPEGNEGNAEYLVSTTASKPSEMVNWKKKKKEMLQCILQIKYLSLCRKAT